MPGRARPLARLLPLALLAAVGLGPAPAHAAPLAVPRTGARLDALVPRGWAIESRREGDLDGDGAPDAVLVLLEKENPRGDRERALVVALRRGAGWEVGGTNRGLVYGWQMAGVKGGDAAPELAISAKGVLAVTQFGGSRWTYGGTHRFRWSAARRRVELVGVDVSSGDASTGASTSSSCNLLTGVCIRTETPESGGPEVRETTQHERKPLPALEDVDGVD